MIKIWFKDLLFNTRVRLYEFFHHREIINKLIEEKKETEKNAKVVINFLQKKGLRMILWEKELSWGENWAKITDGKTNCVFKVYLGNVIPPLKQLKNSLRAMKRWQKKKGKEIAKK